jgi:hypothetical protein
LLCLSYSTIDLKPPTVRMPCLASALKPSPSFPVWSASYCGHSRHIGASGTYRESLMMMSIVLSSLSIIVNLITPTPCTLRPDAIPCIIMLSTFCNEIKCCLHVQMVPDAPVSMQTDFPPGSKIAFPFFCNSALTSAVKCAKIFVFSASVRSFSGLIKCNSWVACVSLFMSKSVFGVLSLLFADWFVIFCAKEKAK